MAKDSRPYFTVTNELFRHPKWTGLPNDKTRLYLLELWGHCNEFRTDGAVAKHVLEAKGVQVAKALLVDWVLPTKNPHEYLMRDYLQHQPSKAEIEERIQDKRDSGKTGGQRSAHKRWHLERGVKSPDCTLCQHPKTG